MAHPHEHYEAPNERYCRDSTDFKRPVLFNLWADRVGHALEPIDHDQPASSMGRQRRHVQ